ncbi:hypothetical protein [Acinetobacter populi]|uniref:Uncharacterized protein n=1 Tax=Acinetobacter populi TaxID=1582270 RepID=A0A1Z9YXT9_9GAMM|nr:hypothetical protein [Acinetobacter populi]OUY06996.1 hypothetical protein CAP51_09885 [Acinetobacter populi]
MSKALIIKANEAMTPGAIQRTALTDKQVYVFDVRSLAHNTVGSRINSFMPNIVSKTSAPDIKSNGVWNSGGIGPFLRFDSEGYYLDLSRSNNDARCYLRSNADLPDSSNNGSNGILLTIKFKVTNWNADYLPAWNAGDVLSSFRIASTGGVNGANHIIRICQFKNKLIVSGLGPIPFLTIDAIDGWITILCHVSSSLELKHITSISNEISKAAVASTISGNIDAINIGELAVNQGNSSYTPQFFLKYLGVYRGDFSDAEILAMFEYVKSI